MRWIPFLALALIAGRPVVAGTAWVLVANQGDHTVTVINAGEERAVATIPEDAVTGHELVASPDGRYAFVPIYGNSRVGVPGIDGRTVDVVDLATRAVVHSIEVGGGFRPHCIRYDPISGHLYVTTEMDRSVTIIDPQTWQVLGRVPTGQSESHMLAITHDGRFGYTANVGPGTISVLDLASRQTVAILPVARHVQRIGLSRDDHWIFTSDTENPRLAMIDARSRTVSAWIALPGLGYGVAADPSGRGVLVAVPAEHALAWVDLGSRRVNRALDLPGRPLEILVTPDGERAFVSCSTCVAVVDLAKWKIEKVITAGKNADGLAWAAK